MTTIAFCYDTPTESEFPWAVLADDGSVLDRFASAEEAQETYPSAFLVRS